MTSSIEVKFNKIINFYTISFYVTKNTFYEKTLFATGILIYDATDGLYKCYFNDTSQGRYYERYLKDIITKICCFSSIYDLIIDPSMKYVVKHNLVDDDKIKMFIQEYQRLSVLPKMFFAVEDELLTQYDRLCRELKILRDISI